MQKKSEILGKLPIHPGDREHPQPHVLRVDGLVGRCLELTAADLKGLPQRELIDDFTCLEGWTVPKLNWRGVPLSAVLALAEMRAEARWVQASAGEFSIPIPIQDAAKVLLATHLGPEALPNEHGGPMRLVVPALTALPVSSGWTTLSCGLRPEPIPAGQLLWGGYHPPSWE